MVDADENEFRRIAVGRRRRIFLLYLLWRMNSYTTKRWWVRPIFSRRREQGDYNNLLQEMRLNDHEMFYNFYRMMPDVFNMLLTMVGPKLQKSGVRSLCPGERLSVTLRYLATGDSMGSISFAFRIGKSTASVVIRETCNAIWDTLSTTVFLEPTPENWMAIAEDFQTLWNFPNCIGAIDGKHVVMQAPNKSGSSFFNYKGSHSIVLMAVCDARYCFTIVDVGSAGRNSDGGIFAQSTFGKMLAKGELAIPAKKSLPRSQTELNYVFVGDGAFPLQENILRPFPGQWLDDDKVIFNYRLSRPRSKIENTFGLVATKWRIFRRPIIGSISLVTAATKAICCLHNFLVKQDYTSRPSKRRYMSPGAIDSGDAPDGEWRGEVDNRGALRHIGRFGANSHPLSAKEQRDEFKSYFMTVGQVPWQWGKIPHRQE